jgi:hypothetical protein
MGAPTQRQQQRQRRVAHPHQQPHHQHRLRAAQQQEVPTSSDSSQPASDLVSLKEWAPVAAALGAGEQTILLRKGGIREPRFTPEAKQFFLFPTSFHTTGQLLKPGVAERYAAEMAMEPKQMAAVPLAQYCEVTGCWTTEDERVLQVRADSVHVCVWGGRCMVSLCVHAVSRGALSGAGNAANTVSRHPLSC